MQRKFIFGISSGFFSFLHQNLGRPYLANVQDNEFDANYIAGIDKLGDDGNLILELREPHKYPNNIWIHVADVEGLEQELNGQKFQVRRVQSVLSN